MEVQYSFILLWKLTLCYDTAPILLTFPEMEGTVGHFGKEIHSRSCRESDEKIDRSCLYAECVAGASSLLA